MEGRIQTIAKIEAYKNLLHSVKGPTIEKKIIRQMINVLEQRLASVKLSNAVMNERLLINAKTDQEVLAEIQKINEEEKLIQTSLPLLGK